jgi:hypothetical protein
MNLKTLTTIVALAATTVTGLADVKLDDNFTLSGYAAGAYMNYRPSIGPSVDSFFDASKPVPGGGDSNDILARLTANLKPFTAVASINYFPKIAHNDISLLDAYVTLDAANGVTLTGGKFLSYLGYESFYPSLMDQISYANGDFLAPIPGYHSGGKIDFANKVFGAGVAVVDSVYSPNGPTRGDGEIKHNGGAEGYFTYTGIENLTLWAGFAYDTKGGFEPHNVTTLDFWGSYQLTKTLRVAGEFVSKDGGPGNRGSNWLAFLNYTFTDKLSSTFRVSGENMRDNGPSFVKLTVCPALNITPNFLIRAEYSYYDYSSYAINHADFVGVQAIFKF